MCASACASAPNLCTQYFLMFFTNGFQIQIYGDPMMDRIMEVLAFGDHRGLICKVTVGLNVWKYCILHFTAMIFPNVFHQWLSNWDIWWPWTKLHTYQVAQFSGWKYCILHFGLNVWKYCLFAPCVHDISKLFYQWLLNTAIWWPWTESLMYQLLVTLV